MGHFLKGSGQFRLWYFLLEGNFPLRHLLNDWALKVNIENFKIVLILSSHKEHHKPLHILKEEKTRRTLKQMK